MSEQCKCLPVMLRTADLAQVLKELVEGTSNTTFQSKRVIAGRGATGQAPRGFLGPRFTLRTIQMNLSPCAKHRGMHQSRH